MTIVLLLLGILLFLGLVVFHEFGHFVAARRNGVVAEEFGIGFPPQIWSRKVKSKKGDYIFSINWIPLGGFVRLKGEHDSDTEKGTFGAASTWVKTKIMAAGIFMNLLAALLLFTVVAWVGMPQVVDNQFTVASDSKLIKSAPGKDVVKIGDVVKGSPADKAGIPVDAQIIAVNGTKITSPSGLLDATKANAGRTVPVVIKQDGKSAQTVPVALANTSPYMGVGPYSGQTGFDFRRSTWSAPIVALGVTRDFSVLTIKAVGETLKGLGSIFAGAITGNTQARQAGQTAASQVTGPVGIVGVLNVGASQGIGFILFIVGLISLSLAIMNLLPIPALDGGKLFITYVSRLMGKQVPEKVENYAYGFSFLLLMVAMLAITVVDIKRLPDWF